VESVVIAESVDARVGPRGSLEILSQAEIDKLLDTSHTGLYTLFRNCALAVLNSGSESDNAKEIFEHYRSFNVQIIPHAWGIKLEMTNAPAAAFVDGQMIHGIKEHVFAVLRDIIYTANEIISAGRLDSKDPASITNAVFHILRNARVLDVKTRPNLVVCWGGHSIGDAEYRYAKRVGYEFGLRALDVCTGCGPGAMKAPMKGAGVGHAKQRITDGRFLGVTEPGIIAAEPPNAIVNQLVIMPDIEKRLEAFLRLGHGIVVFPGGVGTAEEILYLLGVLLDPANAQQPLPVVLTGPRASAGLLRQHRALHRKHPRRRGAHAAEGHHRRSGRGRAPHGAVVRAGARISPQAQRFVQFQLAAAGAVRAAAAVRGSRTPRCAHWNCTARSRCTCWRRICGARFPASLPATSRKTAWPRSSGSGRTNCRATPISCDCWMNC
jgi:predicted Rossmann-fold nucleotide-binding protein